MQPTDDGSLDWDTYAFAFGHRLRVVRHERGISQEQLAERCGMSRNAVSHLERATSNSERNVSDPLMSTVYRLAQALDVPPNYLLPNTTRRLVSRAPEQESEQTLSQVERRLKRQIERLHNPVGE